MVAMAEQLLVGLVVVVLPSLLDSTEARSDVPSRFKLNWRWVLISKRFGAGCLPLNSHGSLCTSTTPRFKYSSNETTNGEIQKLHRDSTGQRHSTTIFESRDPLHTQRVSKMPAIRHASKRKPPPEGFSDIEDDLLIFSNKMKDAQNTSTDNVPKHQAQWPIFQISHQRSRYIYELYYEKEAISKKLYDWLLKNGYADAMLIAKWKKQGYEKVRT